MREALSEIGVQGVTDPIDPRASGRRSDFPDARLLEESGAKWLNPDTEEKLRRPDSSSSLFRKLLFHWKAWAWVYAGKLKEMMDSGSVTRG